MSSGDQGQQTHRHCEACIYKSCVRPPRFGYLFCFAFLSYLQISCFYWLPLSLNMFSDSMTCIFVVVFLFSVCFSFPFDPFVPLVYFVLAQLVCFPFLFHFFFSVCLSICLCLCFPRQGLIVHQTVL